MRKSFRIDEAEYKLGGKYGAMSLISKSLQPYASNAEVNEIGGEYWLSYDIDENEYKRSEASYKNGWSHTIV